MWSCKSLLWKTNFELTMQSKVIEERRHENILWFVGFSFETLPHCSFLNLRFACLLFDETQIRLFLRGTRIRVVV